MIVASSFAKAIEQAIEQARQTSRRQHVRRGTVFWFVIEVGPDREWFERWAFL